MYKLDNNVEWTEELKNAFKTGTTRAKIIYDGDKEINETNALKNLTIKDTQYIPNLGFIGQACSKELSFSFVNTEGINLENKEVIVKIGAEYNGDVYYITYGNFIVSEAPQNDKTNNVTNVVANDYMIKFDVPYEDTITYPCTLKELVENICEKVGVELGSESFSNQDFIVVDNQFENNVAREVIKNAAKCAFSWARIGQDNKLYFDFEPSEEIEIIGSNFTITNANPMQQAEITEMLGNTIQNGTPTPSSPVEVKTVSGDNNIVVSNKNELDEQGLLTKTFSTNTYKNTELDIKGNRTLYFKAQLKEGKTNLSGLYLAIATTKNPHNGTAIFSIKNGAIQTTSLSANLTTETIYISYYPTSFTIEQILDTYNLWVSRTDTTYIAHQGNSYRVDLGGKNIFDKTTIVAGDIRGINTSIRLSSRQALWLDTGTYTMSTNAVSPFRYACSVQNVGVPPLSTYPTYILDSGWKTGNISYTFTLTTPGYFVLALSKTSGNITVEEIENFEYQLEKRKSSNTIQSIHRQPYRTI